MRDKARSDKYQHLYTELLVPPEAWREWGATYGYWPDEEAKQERRSEILELLKTRQLQLIQEVCTPHQRTVITLLMSGLTQWEVAKRMGISQQGTVHKSMYGNTNYRNGKLVSCHGGSIVKLRRAADADPEIQKLLAELRSL